ncbi:MAG: hypothetical protein HUJ68_04815 [Clostridia bacterium]|nr:hypothetical protein [Clostridia bacterium]
MSEKNKKLDINNSYMLKLDNMNIEIEYGRNDKTFKDCMFNILKRRVEK